MLIVYESALMFASRVWPVTTMFFFDSKDKLIIVLSDIQIATVMPWGHNQIHRQGDAEGQLRKQTIIDV